MSYWKWDRATDECTQLTREEWDATDVDPEKRNVARDYLNGGAGRFRVSTVFLGSAYGTDATGPLLFETKVFCQDDHPPLGFEEEVWHYQTAAEARAGHEKAIEWVRDLGWLSRVESA